LAPEYACKRNAVYHKHSMAVILWKQGCLPGALDVLRMEARSGAPLYTCTALTLRRFSVFVWWISITICCSPLFFSLKSVFSSYFRSCVYDCAVYFEQFSLYLILLFLSLTFGVLFLLLFFFITDLLASKILAMDLHVTYFHYIIGDKLVEVFKVCIFAGLNFSTDFLEVAWAFLHWLIFSNFQIVLCQSTDLIHRRTTRNFRDSLLE